jgi:hypothetical protein
MSEVWGKGLGERNIQNGFKDEGVRCEIGGVYGADL